MKKSFLLFAAAAYSVLTPVPGRTQVLLNDNFDSYLDQPSFESVWSPVGSVASGALQGTNWVSAARGVYYGTTAQRNERSFTKSGTASAFDSITFSFNFFDYDSRSAPYRQYANLQDGTSPGSSGQLISLGLNNNLTATDDGGNFYMARILGYNGNAYFKLNDDPALLRTTGWHNLAVTISDVDFQFFVDGMLAETVSQAGLTLRSYDVVRLGSGLSSTNPTFFDDVKVMVNQVPEPTIAAFLGIGLCALIGIRRHRK
jgi:hypothetical protein